MSVVVCADHRHVQGGIQCATIVVHEYHVTCSITLCHLPFGQNRGIELTNVNRMIQIRAGMEILCFLSAAKI